jgi:hypothetical protein
MRRVALVVVLAFTLVVVTGCSGAPQAASPTGSQPASATASAPASAETTDTSVGSDAWNQAVKAYLDEASTLTAQSTAAMQKASDAAIGAMRGTSDPTEAASLADAIGGAVLDVDSVYSRGHALMAPPEGLEKVDEAVKRVLKSTHSAVHSLNKGWAKTDKKSTAPSLRYLGDGVKASKDLARELAAFDTKYASQLK